MAGDVKSIHEERRGSVIAYKLLYHGMDACLSETALETSPDIFY